MKLECTINITEQNPDIIKEVLQNKALAYKKEQYLTLGEYVLTLLENPNESKYFDEHIKKLNLTAEELDTIYSSNEIQFYRDESIDMREYEHYLVIETTTTSTGSKYLYIITSYIADVLWEELKCGLLIQFDTHDDSVIHPFCQYFADGQKKYFDKYFGYFNNQFWVPANINNR